MKKKCFPQITIFLLFFSFITVLHLKAREKQIIASVISKNNPQPVNTIIKCKRKNDDMSKCLSCHNKSGWLKMKYVHGPLAINECRPCHIDPGKEIMKKTEVDLKNNPCVFCHQDNEVKKAHPEILKKKNTDCLTCHNPHASDKEYLLR